MRGEMVDGRWAPPASGGPREGRGGPCELTGEKDQLHRRDKGDYSSNTN